MIIKVDTIKLRLLIELRVDSVGKLSYLVTFENQNILFRDLTSVIDFINMNINRIGYVK